MLALYDGPIRGGVSPLILDMVDASALLWRLMLRGVDLGESLETLADRWAPVAAAGNYAFNDMHAMMAFAGGRTAPPAARRTAGGAAGRHGGRRRQRGLHP